MTQAHRHEQKRLSVTDMSGPIEIREDHVGDIRGGTLVIHEVASAMSAVRVDHLYVHGTLRGTVDASIVTVAKTGRIIGSVNCTELRVRGSVEGGIVADTVTLAGGNIDGEVFADKLHHTDGSSISGQISLGSGIAGRRRTAGPVTSREAAPVETAPTQPVAPLAAEIGNPRPAAALIPPPAHQQHVRTKPFLLLQ